MKKTITILTLIAVTLIASITLMAKDDKTKSTKPLSITYLSTDTELNEMAEKAAVKTIDLGVDSAYSWVLVWSYENNTNTCVNISVTGKSTVTTNYVDLSSDDKTIIDNFKTKIQ